ncbi:MAG TPA: rhomboid family intramembrane serine protease [Desulfuromonadales bacterium]|nr:rhomboid family intramembrane serine protease [Desulfuromonadales bacterium]
MDHSDAHLDEGKNDWRPVTTGYNGVFLTRQQARTWALVLDSRAIPCCIEPVGADWHLLVPEHHLESACREVRLYEAANHNWPPPLPATRQLVENTMPTLSVLLLLAIVHNLSLIGFSLPERGVIDLHGIGAAHAADIRNGLWWQCVTALTLHGDLTHLLSNLSIGGVFIILLCRELGSGLAWTLLLASGATGNLLNAWVQSPAHRSVGASTAVFGAVGILAAVSMVRENHHLRRRWFVPVAAGLALLAILGTEGKNTDLGAHLFGFCTGLLCGAGAEFMVGKFGRPGRLLNVLLALLSGVVVAAAWWAAIQFGA